MNSASCLNVEYYHDIKVIKGRCLIGLAYFGGMPALESFKKKPCLTHNLVKCGTIGLTDTRKNKSYHIR